MTEESFYSLGMSGWPFLATSPYSATTGNEISRCSPYHYGSYPNDRDYILYPPDNDDGDVCVVPGNTYNDTHGTTTDRADGETESGIVYEVHTDAGWLGAVDCANGSDSGYADWNDAPIDGIRAYRTDGERSTIQAVMDDGSEWSETDFYGLLDGCNAEGDGYAGDIGSGHYIIGLRVFGGEVRIATAGKP